MAKQELTREELEEKKIQLEEEVEKLQKIIAASDTSTFEIMIDDIKAEMQKNVIEEDWKVLKQNKLKVEKFREIVKIIQNQDELLEQKQQELDDTVWKLNHLQLNFFTDSESKTTNEDSAVDTGFKSEGATNLYVGDVYKEQGTDADGEMIFYTINHSKEKAGAFALIGNKLEGERLLQYPKNLAILKGCSYVGNVFIEDDDQQNAINAVSCILKE